MISAFEKALKAIFFGKRKADLFSEAVAAGTNFFATDIVADKDCIMRIACALSDASQIKAVITRGATTVEVLLNSGANLSANAIYVFNLPLKEGDKLNLRSGAPTTVLISSVDEIDYAV